MARPCHARRGAEEWCLRTGLCYCRPGYAGLNCSTADDAEADARRAKAEATAKGRRSGLLKCPNNVLTMAFALMVSACVKQDIVAWIVA